MWLPEGCVNRTIVARTIARKGDSPARALQISYGRIEFRFGHYIFRQMWGGQGSGEAENGKEVEGQLCVYHHGIPST